MYTSILVAQMDTEFTKTPWHIIDEAFALSGNRDNRLKQNGDIRS